VLLSDKSILHAPGLEERLLAIRRATALDPKTGMFFMPPMSTQAEIATFARSMFATLQPLVVDYYRDLTKHARRKKARSGSAMTISSSPESGARTLSPPGWNVRYEVKQGIFAEFRQEMDVAERHYTAAIDELFSTEGIFEATPSWSPRWEEARLLCDTIALRVLRCQLWVGLTTGAAVSWVNYKARMKDLIDRRGKGSQTYGWAAWESRWAEIMAQLIQRASLAVLQPSLKQSVEESSELTCLRTYAPADKTVPAEHRLPPFQLLHHPGYWLRVAFEAAEARYEKASGIPKEDQTPPGQSPASAVSHRHKHYDTYLVAEPHEEYPHSEHNTHDHLAHLTSIAEAAIEQFSIRGQTRPAERIRYQLALQIASFHQNGKVLETLRPFWDECTWRDDDWADLFCSLLRLLHRCAISEKDAELALQTAWELLRTDASDHPMVGRDLAQYFTELDLASERTSLRFQDGDRFSPVALTFAFTQKETYVAEPLECQVSVCSLVPQSGPDISISRIELTLTNEKVVTIAHTPTDSKPAAGIRFLDHPAVTEDENTIRMEADLELQSASPCICSFDITFREAGVVSLRQASIFLEHDAFSLEHAFTRDVLFRSRNVYIPHEGIIESKLLRHTNTTEVTVHPKPPKVEILVHGLQKEYYANERIHLRIEFINGEAEPIKGSADASFATQLQEPAKLSWTGSDDDESKLLIEHIETSGSHKAGLVLTAPSKSATLTINIEISYSLESDLDTTLVKTLTLELNVIIPFTATYNCGPLLHQDPWPSYFHMEIGEVRHESGGIQQRWHLGCSLASVAQSELTLRSTRLIADDVGNDAVSNLREPKSMENQIIPAGDSTHPKFEFITRKKSLDDRRPTPTDLSLEVTWSRGTDGAEVLATLPVPRLTLPSSEPRVLCTVSQCAADPADLIVQYHLENPSTHFLTFALTMEASDEFAFAGPKHRALSLSPLSRLTVDYQIMLHDEDETQPKAEPEEGRCIWPQLQVVDSYYQKQLRVHAAGPGVIVDEKLGLGVVVDQIEE
jgi:trafficking protein particle complex subunit 11